MERKLGQNTSRRANVVGVVAIAAALLYARAGRQPNIDSNSPNGNFNSLTTSATKTPEIRVEPSCFQFPIRHPNAVFIQGFESYVPEPGQNMFDYRKSIHPGWDLGVVGDQPGEPIYPFICDDSVVLESVAYQFFPGGRLFTGYDPYLGYTVVLDQGKYVTIYAHLEQIFVKPGQIVNKNQIIGTMGYTGSWQGTNPHLHIELMIKVEDNIGHINLAGLVPNRPAPSTPTPELANGSLTP